MKRLTFWFFISLLFLLYGLIILAMGIYYWVTHVVGPNTSAHVSVWWGIVLLVMSGVFWVIHRKSS